MNTRLLMATSAIIIGLVGVALSFAPDDILKALNIAPYGITKLIVQLMGALYIGFAILNWMAKGALIGGIFAKPISMANCTHFFIGAMAIVKVAAKTTGMPLLWVLFGVYAVYAGWFFLVAFSAPAAPSKSPSEG